MKYLITILLFFPIICFSQTNGWLKTTDGNGNYIKSFINSSNLADTSTYYASRYRIDSTNTALGLKQPSLGYTPLNPANNLSEVTAVTARTNLGLGTLATQSGTFSGTSSGTNTGDNSANSLYSGLISNATHTGDATGSTALTVVKINGTSMAGLATGILKNTTGTGVPSIAAQADITALLGAASITNIMIANGAVANLSGTNTGDNSANSTYANDFRTANFVAGTNYLAPNGSAASLTSFPTFNQSTTGSAATLTTSRTIGITGDVTYTSPSFNGSGNVTSTATVNSITGKLTSYNAISTVGNGVPSLVATIDATAQVANIATATLYSVPASGAGMYRISIYVTVTSVGTTSTMPSTTITYTDGNAGTNAHSTVTTATSAGNSVTTTFAQTTYVLYAKASTNIQYATGSYASTGSAMQYALRIKCEAL